MIKNKLNNKHNKSIERLPVLTLQEENIILSCAQFLCDHGFPATTQDLCYFIKTYLDMKNRSMAQFQKNLPGSEYMFYLLRRDKEFTKRPVANIKRSTAVVDKNVMQQYHDNLSKELDDMPPSNIWNYDKPALLTIRVQRNA